MHLPRVFLVSCSLKHRRKIAGLPFRRSSDRSRETDPTLPLGFRSSSTLKRQSLARMKLPASYDKSRHERRSSGCRSHGIWAEFAAFLASDNVWCGWPLRPRHGKKDLAATHYSQARARWAEPSRSWVGKSLRLMLTPKASPSICADICSWEALRKFAPGYFDMT